METGISIKGGDVDREGVKAVAKGIERVLRAGHESRAEQETIRAALSQFGRIANVEGTRIEHCHLEG